MNEEHLFGVDLHGFTGPPSFRMICLNAYRSTEFSDLMRYEFASKSFPCPFCKTPLIIPQDPNTFTKRFRDKV